MSGEAIGGVLLEMEEPVRDMLDLVRAARMATNGISDKRQCHAMMTLLERIEDTAAEVKALWDKATAHPV
jgi:hypothetical protein